MPPNRLVLLVGGARSGKSALAVRLAERSRAPVCFVATATASDDDLARRIERHQAERPDTWNTIEAPVAVAAAVRAAGETATVVVDCITLWVANLLAGERSDTAIEAHASELAAVLSARAGLSIVVSNEVGLGVHPATELGRRYRDVLGRCNQHLAASAGRALLLVAGRAVELREPLDLVADLLPAVAGEADQSDWLSPNVTPPGAPVTGG